MYCHPSGHLLLVRSSRRLISYASANCRDRRISYSAVCSKQVTLLGNANGADRKPAVSAEPNKHMPAISSLCAPSASREESTQRSALANRGMSDDDHNLDDLKDRLYRSFGVEVRPDLQVRAEIIIQPEEGRWVFTPDELRDLAHGLESILLNSSPAAGWPFRLTLKQYIGLFGPLVTFP